MTHSQAPGPIGPRQTGQRFADRRDAGHRLGERLEHLRGTGAVVVGIPRGGVPVAAEVARRLAMPLDAIIVRKLGVPVHPELAMGAVGEGGVRVLDTEIIRASGVTAAEVEAVVAREEAVVARRAEGLRTIPDRTPLTGRMAIVVDDGLATGSTARAACLVARAEGARGIVLAVPVAPPDWTARLGDVADELVSVATPDPFVAVGSFYDDFRATTDAEVSAILQRPDGVPAPDAVGGASSAPRPGRGGSGRQRPARGGHHHPG